MKLFLDETEVTLNIDLVGDLGEAMGRLGEELMAGEHVHVTRFANDDMEDVVSKHWLCNSVTADGFTALYETQEPEFTGTKAEEGFVTKREGNIVLVRFDGETIEQFPSMIEAQEYIDRDGYGVREEEQRAVVHHLGQELASFGKTKDAWKYLKAQMALK